MEVLITLKKNTGIMVGGSVILVFTLIAILAPLLAPYDPYEQNVTKILVAPDREHLAGTDPFGRDIFSRIIFGIRLSLLSAFFVSTVSCVFAIILGSIAAFYVRFDNIIMRIMDAMMAFPSIFLALGLVAIFKPSLKGVVLALSITCIPRLARIVRSSSLQVRENDYIAAAVSVGANDFHMIFKHILPNIMPELIVQLTFIFAYAVLGEAVLSFLGAGPPPPAPSLGNVLSDARDFLFTEWWMPILPGLVIMLLVLNVNLLGDGLRDALDPKLREIEMR